MMSQSAGTIDADAVASYPDPALEVTSCRAALSPISPFPC
jgi:hypothetical protein